MGEGSIGIGLIGGLVYSISSHLLKKMRIDDPIDAFSVHGACGIWGVVATGFFGVQEYICGDPASTCVNLASQTAMQIVGVLCIILWTSVTSILLFGGLRLGNLLRVSEEAEIRGLDQDHHLGYTGILRYAEEVELTKLGSDMEDGSVSHPVSADNNAEQKFEEHGAIENIDEEA